MNTVEVKLDDFQKLLKDRLDGKVFQESLEVLEPFYSKAASGKYNLSATDKITPRDIFEVLEALGERVYSTLYLSSRRLLEKPAWVSEELGFASTEKVVVSHFVESLSAKLTALFGPQAPSTVEIFAADFENYLGKRLKQALQHTFNFTEEEMVRHRGLFEAICEGGVLLPLSIYITLVLEHRDRQLKSLIPLIRALPNFIPIAEIRNKPGTWIVLTV